MFNAYQTEIFGLVALLLVSLAYLIYKSKTNKKVLPQTEIKQEQEVEDISEIVLEQEEDIVDEYDNEDLVLDGNEEGSFGEAIEESPQEETPSQANSTITKREVPPHGKITKENFKEFAGHRIIVAEDNLINQKVIQGLLADSGIEIKIANDGQEALDILENDTNFLLVLMDAHMPRVDGFEATRIIRANPNYSHILVVALSGDTASDDIKKMTEAGMQEHLEKPLRINDLYDILYAYTGTSTQQQEIKEDEILVVMTKELNGDKGLDICGGDETFYHEILNEFIKTYKNSDEILTDLLNSHKTEEANKLLLDILGVTANIGAESLNETTQTIKHALVDKDENKYKALLVQYKMHLNALVDDIQNYTQP